MKSSHMKLAHLSTISALLLLLIASVGQGQDPSNTEVQPEHFSRAADSAKIAGYSLSKTQRWLHEVALKCIDPQTKLLVARGEWNYRNTAADCYPFVCWAAYATDYEALNGPVRDVLRAEIEHCNHLDRLPVPYDFKQRAKKTDQSHDLMMFGVSEYVKDGLIAIVEITGKDEWFDRMVALEDDMWKHARLQTPFGKIPSIDKSVMGIEIDGEQLQALTRLYTMTGDKKYLTWAQRLGDYYLLRDNYLPPQLRDHGCEIIGGLGLLLAVESQADPKKLAEHLPPFKKMLDTVLKRGCTADGFMYNKLDGLALPPHKAGSLSDGWGYNYVAYLCYDMIVGRPHYRQQIERTLRNLEKPATRAIGLDGDSLADSTEGAMYLLNRYPVPEANRWLDRLIGSNLVASHVPLNKAQLWDFNKWHSNCVRTTIMHALMHTQGLIARPWRHDMQLGACAAGDALVVVIKAEKPYYGRLVFDVPRYRIHMGFKRDWPRMNTLPEWFTVEPQQTYTVEDLTAGTNKVYTGKQLHAGLPVRAEAGKELRLIVRPCGTAGLTIHQQSLNY